MPKITQIATAVAQADGAPMIRTICLDDQGRAHELKGSRWVALPELPQCTCGTNPAATKNPTCPYHVEARRL